MTKQQIISARILAHVANGMQLKEAFDAVLGEGAYMKMAAEVWAAARAK